MFIHGIYMGFICVTISSECIYIYIYTGYWDGDQATVITERNKQTNNRYNHSK